MKVINKVKGNFVTLSDKEFVVLAQTVLRAMSNNSNFLSPEPSLAELEIGISKFSDTLASSNKRGSPEDTAIKDVARKELAELIRRLAYYVNLTSKSQLHVLLSSGIPIFKTGVRLGLPGKVEVLTIRDGKQKGQINLSFKALKNVRLYRYRCTSSFTDDKELLWPEEEYSTTSSKNNLIAPVIPGVTYYISVQAINSAGVDDWCDPVAWIAR